MLSAVVVIVVMLNVVMLIVVMLIVLMLNVMSGILLNAFMVIVVGPSETNGLAYFFEVTAMKNKIDISGQ